MLNNWVSNYRYTQHYSGNAKHDSKPCAKFWRGSMYLRARLSFIESSNQLWHHLRNFAWSPDLVGATLWKASAGTDYIINVEDQLILGQDIGLEKFLWRGWLRRERMGGRFGSPNGQRGKGGIRWWLFGGSPSPDPSLALSHLAGQTDLSTCAVRNGAGPLVALMPQDAVVLVTMGTQVFWFSSASLLPHPFFPLPTVVALPSLPLVTLVGEFFSNASKNVRFDL